MRIAVFHELHQGGARRAVNELAKQLKKRHTVDLYSTDAKQDTTEKKYFTHSYFFPFVEKKWTGRNWKVKLSKDTFELVKLFFLHRKIAHHIDQREYDLVFVHPSKFTQAPFILRFLKSKTVYYCQEPLRIVYEDTFALPEGLTLLSWVYESVNRLVKKHLDMRNMSAAKILMCNSQFSASAIRKAYGRESIVCYLGVDSHFFKPLQLKKTIDILFIGSKDRIDGFDLFEKAQKYLPHETKTLVIESFRNRVPDTKLIKIYNKSKIVVALAINEPFGLIPLEAAACETPVVAVNEGGYKETIIHGKTGYLVKRDPLVLASVLKTVIKNEKILQDLGENARLNVLENWTWEKSAKKIELEFLKTIQ